MSENVKGSFVFGMRIGDALHTDFVVREPLVSDMIEAEKIVPPTPSTASVRLAMAGLITCTTGTAGTRSIRRRSALSW